MTFKEKLVILRKTRGLTQDEFASAVGVSRQAVYKWECGQSYPEVPKLLEIKTLFSISIDDLLDDNFDIPVPEKKKRKRISKEAKERIEKNVEKTEIKEPQAKAAPVKEEPKTEKEPKKEENDSFNIVVKSQPNEAPKAEVKEEEEKKTGFFGRFFTKR
ncbi:MAG: helix-turn-helix transcriptional regulator [Clostridia bacterium]|nr:helix-turn-helix transcriptional regulator [Clostridia bacterium]